jgi:hypothetical protein
LDYNYNDVHQQENIYNKIKDITDRVKCSESKAGLFQEFGVPDETICG